MSHVVAYFAQDTGALLGYYAPNRAKRQIMTLDRAKAQSLSRDKAHEIAMACPTDTNKRAEAQPR